MKKQKKLIFLFGVILVCGVSACSESRETLESPQANVNPSVLPAPPTQTDGAPSGSPSPVPSPSVSQSATPAPTPYPSVIPSVTPSSRPSPNPSASSSPVSAALKTIQYFANGLRLKKNLVASPGHDLWLFGRRDGTKTGMIVSVNSKDFEPNRNFGRNGFLATQRTSNESLEWVKWLQVGRENEWYGIAKLVRTHSHVGIVRGLMNEISKPLWVEFSQESVIDFFEAETPNAFFVVTYSSSNKIRIRRLTRDLKLDTQFAKKGLFEISFKDTITQSYFYKNQLTVITKNKQKEYTARVYDFKIDLKEVVYNLIFTYKNDGFSGEFRPLVVWDATSDSPNDLFNALLYASDSLKEGSLIHVYSLKEGGFRSLPFNRSSKSALALSEVRLIGGVYRAKRLTLVGTAAIASISPVSESLKSIVQVSFDPHKEVPEQAWVARTSIKDLLAQDMTLDSVVYDSISEGLYGVGKWVGTLFNQAYSAEFLLPE